MSIDKFLIGKAKAVFEQKRKYPPVPELFVQEEVNRAVAEMAMEGNDLGTILDGLVAVFDMENFFSSSPFNLNITTEPGRSILQSALGQALALVNSDELLKWLVANGPQITADSSSVKPFLEQLINADIPIVLEEHGNGYRGHRDDHGSVFLSEDRSMEIRFDKTAQSNLSEIIHEYAVYLALKKGNNGVEFESESDLLRAKNEYLSYITSLIDSLSLSSNVRKMRFKPLLGITIPKI